jgi:hypothetical protein
MKNFDAAHDWQYLPAVKGWSMATGSIRSSG